MEFRNKSLSDKNQSGSNKIEKKVYSNSDGTFMVISMFNMQSRRHQKEYMCMKEDCQKVFKKNSNLLNHLRVHSESRPFSCKVCKEAFN